MKWLIASLILTLNLFACDIDLDVEGETHKVCVFDQNIYSKGCKGVSDCFKFKNKKLKYYPNQDPRFSLCYQNGWKPSFAKLDGKTVSVCMNSSNQFVDMESLMKSFNLIVQ
ncbi:MAG: hypothetical protein KC478_14465 [Bacteriovoracaceae bacterium]|nr:hypothetical protein [Bacteriovoracaceae bacterium]